MAKSPYETAGSTPKPAEKAPLQPIPHHLTPEYGAEQASEVMRHVREGIERSKAPDAPPRREGQGGAPRTGPTYFEQGKGK